MQGVIDAGTTQALAMVQQNIEPYLIQVQQDAAAAQEALTEAMDLVQAILEGGTVPAASIAESTSRVFVTPAQKDQIAANTAAITTKPSLGLTLALG